MTPRSVRTLRVATRLAVAMWLVGACGQQAAPATTGSTTSEATPSARSSASDPWAADLDRLDRSVRSTHVSPFTLHTEAEWASKVAEVAPKLAGASADERVALVASVVALLDTHTYVWRKDGFHAYPVLVYKFSDGWFVIAAEDASLVGSRLISIGGHPVTEVEATLRTLVSFDNESGFVDSGEGLFSMVEYLHGSGLVADPIRPAYVFELPDGSQRAADFQAIGEQAWAEGLGILGSLVGDAPEAVARRGERAWSRLDTANRAFLIAVNDYGDTTAQVAAMQAALDAGTADRVVLDIRYLRGGNGDFQLLDILKAEPRVNRPGGLTVLIGRENQSIATSIVRDFDVNSEALLVGEPTPARADNFRCDCVDLELPSIGVVVTIPTWWDRLGDDRPEVPPDVPVTLSSEDFFAGRDPVLDAALAGLTP